MNVLGMFKGDYIAAVEFNGKTPTLTIDHVNSVELEGEDGTKKGRPVVFFRETRRGWVLCKTTAQSLAAMFTPETDTWTGKRVTLVSEIVNVGKEKVPGIRVKGSPDLTAAVTFDLKLPRKKPRKVTLVPTAKDAPAHAPEDAAPPAEPVTDPATGETF